MARQRRGGMSVPLSSDAYHLSMNERSDSLDGGAHSTPLSPLAPFQATYQEPLVPSAYASDATERLRLPDGVPAMDTDVAQDLWTVERREMWRRWLASALVAAKYAVVLEREGGQIRYFLTDLARACGIPRPTLLPYLAKGSRPTMPHASALARALGLHPLAVAFRAGLISREEMIEAVGSGRFTAPEEIRDGISGLEMLPPSAWRDSILRRSREELADAERLRVRLGLSPEEYGSLAADIIAREVYLDQSPLATPQPLGLPPEWGDSPAPLPHRTRQPGPNRRRVVTNHSQGVPEVPDGGA